MSLPLAQGSRHEETFPTLTAPEIERLRRYGASHAYADGEKLVEIGKAGPGRVRRPVGRRRAHRARRSRPCGADRRAGSRAIPRRSRRPVGRRRAGRRDGRGRGRGAAHTARQIALPPDRRRRSGRADHARDHPPARGPHPIGRGRRRPDRTPERRGRRPPRSVSRQKWPSPALARSGDRSAGKGGHRPLCGHRRRPAACRLPGRDGARQSVRSRARPPDRIDRPLAGELRL